MRPRLVLWLCAVSHRISSYHIPDGDPTDPSHPTLPPAWWLALERAETPVPTFLATPTPTKATPHPTVDTSKVPTDLDLLCYSRRYQDLQDAYGYNVAALRIHWEARGKPEGRDPFCRATMQPTRMPSLSPTALPTSPPTRSPTVFPTTRTPIPTPTPTRNPSPAPTDWSFVPTRAPTGSTDSPSLNPTLSYAEQRGVDIELESSILNLPAAEQGTCLTQDEYLRLIQAQSPVNLGGAPLRSSLLPVVPMAATSGSFGNTRRGESYASNMWCEWLIQPTGPQRRCMKMKCVVSVGAFSCTNITQAKKKKNRALVPNGW
jgi:hypothetical protein